MYIDKPGMKPNHKQIAYFFPWKPSGKQYIGSLSSNLDDNVPSKGKVVILNDNLIWLFFI